MTGGIQGHPHRQAGHLRLADIFLAQVYGARSERYRLSEFLQNACSRTPITDEERSWMTATLKGADYPISSDSTGSGMVINEL
jgi:hypothetical protein